ncbi:MAG: response regulator [Pseudomonadota bacterium]
MRAADGRRTGAETHETETADEPAGAARNRAAGLIHDVRDALSTIASAAMLLRASGLREEQAPYIAAIEAAADKMTGMTEALAEDNRVRGERAAPPAPAQPSDIRVADLVAHLHSTLRVRCEAVGVESRFAAERSLPSTVRLDKMRVLRVLDNLITNAATATRTVADGAVEVRMAGEADRLVFVVTDNGPGLGPDPERWFARGATGKADAEGGDQQGLGLWVARRSAQAMEASLQAVNGERGARFALSIPGVIAPDAEADPDRASVLVVDANPVGRELMRAILSNLGADVSLAGSLSDAHDLAHRRDFSLVVVDFHLPDGAGVELARALRETRPDLRIVAATSGGMEASRAIADGLFSGLLQKPIDPRALSRLLSEQ